MKKKVTVANVSISGNRHQRLA